MQRKFQQARGEGNVRHKAERCMVLGRTEELALMDRGRGAIEGDDEEEKGKERSEPAL